MRIIRWMGHHGRNRGSYHLARDVPTDPALVNRVFPFLDELRDMQSREFSHWRQEVIELLEFLGKVMLQDVAVIYDDLENNCSLRLCDPFTSKYFFEYQQEVVEAVASDDSLDPSKFKFGKIWIMLKRRWRQ
mmetsp:Transcript_13878/g.40588  ORF Transcript_13878/g.40588 Transcript_13878/m.40588 type:complete len:132 (+) Transcript_13878:725-1120(+)